LAVKARRMEILSITFDAPAASHSDHKRVILAETWAHAN
jgi:hypothetical protein